jgi:hypothetical protein
MKQGPWSWWLSRAFFINQPASIVLLGDSQMNAAVFQADVFTARKDLDCATDREAITLEQDLKSSPLSGNRVLNLALAGAMASDQYLLSKALLTAIPPKFVIVGVSPRCFIDNSLPSASASEPFQFFNKYVDLKSLSGLVFSDQINQANWQIRHYLPLLIAQNRALTWFQERVAGTPSKSSKNLEAENRMPRPSPNMLRAIYGSQGDVKPGEAMMSPAVITGFYDNSREYAARYREIDTPNYKAQKVFFANFLSSLNQLGCRVVVVEMPSTKKNQVLLPPQFWSQYKLWITSQCAANNALWVDLSEDPQFTQPYFLDTVHLNPFGARLLMQRLAAILVAAPKCMQMPKPI